MWLVCGGRDLANWVGTDSPVSGDFGCVGADSPVLDEAAIHPGLYIYWPVHLLILGLSSL